jgi:hypothetical protein
MQVFSVEVLVEAMGVGWRIEDISQQGIVPYSKE